MILAESMEELRKKMKVYGHNIKKIRLVVNEEKSCVGGKMMMEEVG